MDSATLWAIAFGAVFALGMLCGAWLLGGDGQREAELEVALKDAQLRNATLARQLREVTEAHQAMADRAANGKRRNMFTPREAP